jgi:membrane protease YdiL (CAAX protease family)
MKNLIRNNKLVTYVAITFLFSWACWLSIFNDLKPSLFEFDQHTLIFFLLGAYAPSIVALILTLYLDGPGAVKQLLKRLIMWRVGFSWNFLALIVGPVIYTLAIIIYAGNGGFLGAVNSGLLPWIPVVFLFSILLGPLAEELGWRGFVLPCLDAKNKFILTSIIIGLIWGAWHIPLFWAVIGTSVSGFPVTIQSVGLFFLAAIGTSFFYVWMFNKTMGSVFIAVLIHLSWNASGNITSMLFPDMNASQKLELFNYPVAIVWAILLTSAVVYWARRAAIPVATK